MKRNGLISFRTRSATAFLATAFILTAGPIDDFRDAYSYHLTELSTDPARVQWTLDESINQPFEFEVDDNGTPVTVSGIIEDITPLEADKDLIEKYEEKRKSLGLDKVKEYEEGEFFIPTMAGLL